MNLRERLADFTSVLNRTASFHPDRHVIALEAGDCDMKKWLA